ncbi:potassium/proton antiporter [Alkalicoccus luteus]|uniref:potassium/proton antiporter n=1 Tax=Alkalicoccus luteus TaxID=1237094 RepID=UPI004034EF42
MVDTTQIDTYLILSAFILISGVLAAKFSNRVGLPSLVLFILLGMLVGSDGLGIVYFDSPELAQLVGVFALVIILFEGGLQTKFATVRAVALPSISLATVGVILTSGIVGLAAYLIFDITMMQALLLGAIVGSTDAAAVFAALKERNIKAKMGATLEAESGTNDPMAVFLTIGFIELIIIPETAWWALLPEFVWQMGIGLIVGIAVGKIASIAINRVKLDSSGLYPIFSVAFALLTYGAASAAGASGFLAVYIAALVIGNSELTYRYSIFQFNEGFAWMAQILMFILLGLLVFPADLFSLDIIIGGLLLSAALIFIARPAAVYLSTLGMGYKNNEKLFLSWAGLRGAVPIILATFPIVAGVENSEFFFNIVFFVVLTSALVQGTTISPLAKRLGLMGPKKDNPHHSIELISMGKANAEMVQFKVDGDALIAGQKLKDVDFPRKASISAIVRDETLITPYGETEIQNGDFLYILVASRYKRELKRALEQKKSPQPPYS